MSNPYELIYYFRQNPDYCIKELLNEHETLIYAVILRIVKGRTFNAYRDILYSEACYALIEALNCYREDSANKWPSFLALVIHNRIINTLRKNQNNTTIINNCIEIDAFVAENGVNYEFLGYEKSLYNPEYNMDYVLLLDKMRDVYNNFSDEDKVVYDIIIHNGTYVDGMTRLGCTRKNWYVKKKKVVNKIKECIFEDEGIY